MQQVLAFMDALWFILVESGVWLIAGFAFAGVVHAFVPSGWVMKQLGGRGIGSIVKASLLGLPLPLCSCSVIPVAAGLRRDGASKGASAAFAVSTPQTGEESIPLTWALLGPWFAISRPIAAIATALATGLAVEAVEKDDAPSSETDPEPTGGCCGGSEDTGDIRLAEMPITAAAATEQPTKQASASGCCSSTATDGEERASRSILATKAASALRHGFGTMLVDLAPWLAIGFIAAAAVSAFVPTGWIGENLGSAWVQMAAMLVVGVPVYICATSSTPLAYSLIVAGLSPGAAIVLLLSGPATNTATIAWVVKDLGRRAAVAYVGTIAVMSLAAGALFHVFLSDRLVLAAEGSHHEHGAGVLMLAGGVVFTAMLLVALGVRLWPRFGRRLAGRSATSMTP